MKVTICHPLRPHYAKGLCSACYQRQHRSINKPKTKATCHPERAHKCRGLCSACYQALKASGGFVPKGRATTQITCGHPDKKHVGNGMCGACNTRSRRSRDKRADRIARKDYHLRSTYGITLCQFNEMFSAQGDSCALCRKEVPIERNRHVDHCHETGVIRGILCFDCNKGLGLLGDTEKSLAMALEYVSAKRIAAQAGVFVPLERAA